MPCSHEIKAPVRSTHAGSAKRISLTSSPRARARGVHTGTTKLAWRHKTGTEHEMFLAGKRDAADVVLRLLYHSDSTVTDSLPGEPAHVPKINNGEERDLPIQNHLLDISAPGWERRAPGCLASGWQAEGRLARRQDLRQRPAQRKESRSVNGMSASRCAATAASSRAQPRAAARP
jgi:hypothetical protein